MLKVVAENGDDLIIQDSDDCSFDVVSKSDSKLLLKYGVEVQGLSLNNNNLIVSDVFFLEIPNDDDSDEYDWEDEEGDEVEEDFYDYEEDDGEEDDFYDEEGYEEEEEDEIEEEEEEDDFYDDYDWSDYDEIAELSKPEVVANSIIDLVNKSNDTSGLGQNVLNALSNQNRVLPLNELYQVLVKDGNLNPALRDSIMQLLTDNDYKQSVTSKLYTILGGVGSSLIKKYYLWYSRRLFIKAKKDPLLRLKPSNAAKKKQALSNLRTGGEWHYAGFIDGGYDGADFCTLGHKLRYTHLAWNIVDRDIDEAFFGDGDEDLIEDAISSNDCIKFGIVCISDFFEVDKDCTRALQQAQNESLKDMERLYNYYSEGIVDTVNSSFSYLDELVNKIALIDTKGAFVKDYEPILDFNLVSFYKQFRKEGVVPPKSMIQELRDKLVGWSSHKWIYEPTLKYNVSAQLHLIDSKLLAKRISIIFGSKKYKNYLEYLENYTFLIDRNHLSKYSYSYIAYYWMHKICGFYEYDGNINKDEGGANSNYLSIYKSFKSFERYFFKGFEYSLGYLTKVLDCLELCCSFPTRNDCLKVSSLEIDDSGLYYITENVHYDFEVISEYSRECKNNLVHDVELIDKIHNRFYIYDYTVDDFYNLVKTAIDNIITSVPDFQSWYRKKLEERRDKSNEYNKHKEEERKEKEKKEEEQEVIKTNDVSTPDELLEYLKKADLSKVSGVSLQKDILNSVIKYNSMSSKQFYHLKLLYEKVSDKKYEGKGLDNSSEKKVLSDDKELETALKYMLEHPSLINDERVESIIKSIVRYNSISEKQMKYALSVKAIYDGLEDK